MDHDSNSEYRRPFVEIEKTRLDAEGPDATHTGRVMLPVPKRTITARARSGKAELDSQTPRTTTLCINKQALPKACLLAATDARDATEWQSINSMLGTRTNSQGTGGAESVPQATTSDVFGMQREARMSMKAFKNLAKGSVGIMGIKKPPPKAKATAFVMPKTKRQDELLASVIARSAAYLRAKTKTETRNSGGDPESTKNRMVANAIVPQLYSEEWSKFVNRNRKKKRRKTSGASS